MTLPPFVGRRQELQLLDRLWNDQRARLLILYGRRRVGKTRLVTEWIRRTGSRMLYWCADPDSRAAHLRSFSQAVFRFAFPGAPVPGTFTYADWEQAFQQVAAAARASRLGVFIDEFTYLLEADPSLAGIFQRIWDQILESENILMVISGSHLGMMQRQVLSYQAPLYGRASASLLLPPLPFGATAEYFPHYSADQRVTLYTIFGGIPAYWSLLDPGRSIDENIIAVLLSPGALIHSEPRLLLQDFITDTHNYVSILRAIAHRHTAPKDIAAFTGIDNNHLPPYLNNLSETGFVRRYDPVTARQPTRIGRYTITDPFLRFYFRFLASRGDQVALAEPQQALREIQRHLPDFIGANTWEELCREWVLRAASRGVIPLFPDRVDCAWDKAAQVDVVGINFMEKHLVAGECKWLKAPVESSVLRDLVDRKLPRIMPGEGGPWKVYLLLFSRSGWEPGVEAWVDALEQTPRPTGPVQIVGAKLVNLEALDRDLAEWTRDSA